MARFQLHMKTFGLKICVLTIKSFVTKVLNYIIEILNLYTFLCVP